MEVCFISWPGAVLFWCHLSAFNARQPVSIMSVHVAVRQSSAWACLKVQCNPVICRVVRKIHSPLTPIRVLSLLMQLIRMRCYLRNTEQFNTLLSHAHTHARTHTCTPTHVKPGVHPMTTFGTATFAHSCFTSERIFKCMSAVCARARARARPAFFLFTFLPTAQQPNSSIVSQKKYQLYTYILLL